MPTAAKLIAAFFFAILGYVAAVLYIPTLPEGTQVAFFPLITAVIGMISGWKVMGNLVGVGYWASMSSGLQTSVVVVFFTTFGFSTYRMIVQSTRGRYEGPSEAVLAAFQLMLDYLLLLATPATPVALVAGGILGGLITEWASKRWS
jgi:hypothetical protein